MANEEKEYTSEFKAKVALEALAQQKKNLDRLSDKHNVPVSAILTWTVQLEKNATNVFATSEEPEHVEDHIADHESVDVEIDNPEIAESVSYGVMQDKLNIRRLAFWSVLGMVLVAIFTIGLIEMYQYNEQVTRDRVSEASEYYQVNELNREAEETLNSFGVVDLENGVYRIPIDSVMNEMASEDNN